MLLVAGAQQSNGPMAHRPSFSMGRSNGAAFVTPPMTMELAPLRRAFPTASEMKPQAEVESASAAVERMNPMEDPSWDRRLLAHPDYSFFAGSAWAKVLSDSYGYTPAYLTSVRPGALHSVLPLMEVKSRLTGCRGVSLPFTDDCKVLSLDPGSARAIIEEAMKCGRARAWKCLELRGGRELFPAAPASTSFYGHRLDLACGEQRLFASFEGSVRRAIRKAEKLGVKVEISHTLEALRDFYTLHCKTRKKHGLPPQPFLFFRNLHKHVLGAQQGFVALARYRQKVIAAGVYIHLGSRAIYKYGASDAASQELRGNNLVMWEAIKRLAQNGFESLDLGRTSGTDTGLRRFKLGWGACERSIDYLRYDFMAQRFVVARDQASGWHNLVFRILPIALSRTIGGALYRHAA